MEDRAPDCRLSEEDLRAALKEMRSYVDVTEEDLKKIYEIALRHARQRAALHVPVRTIMTSRVISIGPEADVHEAARLLSEHRISGMPVVDDRERILGVISEADLLTLAGLDRGHTFRDIIRRVITEPRSPRKPGDKVGDVMSVPPVTAGPEDNVARIATVLDERRIKRMPVVDDTGRVIGIISRGDIVRAIGKQ